MNVVSPDRLSLHLYHGFVHDEWALGSLTSVLGRDSDSLGAEVPAAHSSSWVDMMTGEALAYFAPRICARHQQKPDQIWTNAEACPGLVLGPTILRRRHELPSSGCELRASVMSTVHNMQHIPQSGSCQLAPSPRLAIWTAITEWLNSCELGFCSISLLDVN